MSKKVLFCATVRSHIGQFHIPYLKYFKEKGYEVHVAAKDNSSEKNIDIQDIDVYHNLSFERSPLKINNIKAYTQMKKILKDNEYEIIHCHTPMGGVVTRLAAKNVKSNAKIIYTAHGFHFYKGAPKKNWMIYLTIEKWLSKYTDCLITINEEDYATAKSKKFKTKEIKLVNGVGVDFTRFSPQTKEDREKIRNEYGYDSNSLILLYAAELTYRKHQDLLINAVSIIKNGIPNLKLLIAGVGNLEEQYKSQVSELKLDSYVEFLGYRRDIPKLMKASDIVVSSSRQEGLPVNIMEAMATRLPLIVTDCRGNRDLVKNEQNGYVVDIDDIEGFANSVIKLGKSEKLRDEFSEKSLELVKNFSLDEVMKQMQEIYCSCEK